MIIFSIITIAVLVAVDQLIKMNVITYLKPVGTIPAIDNLLEFKYIENSGATFGMFQEMSTVFAILTLCLCGVLLYLLITYKNHNFLSYFAGITIIAGGLGNFIDRIVFGYVIDYIHVMFFPYVFNFADSLVVLGVIAFSIYILFFMYKEEDIKNKEKKSDND